MRENGKKHNLSTCHAGMKKPRRNGLRRAKIGVEMGWKKAGWGIGWGGDF